MKYKGMEMSSGLYSQSSVFKYVCSNTSGVIMRKLYNFCALQFSHI
jgi:hypothetical protein